MPSFKEFKDKYLNLSFLKSRFLLLFLILLISGFSLIPQIVQAVSRVYGAAWWGDDLEYLYFDCTEYETGSRFDAPENFNDPPDPPGFHFFIGGCVIPHHVNIDDDGNFFGAAFNFNKGMVNFGGSSTPVTVPDYSFNSNCLNTCNAANFCSACYNSQHQRVYGYAQVESTGELIRLDSAQAPSPENNLQIKSWNLSSTTKPFYNVDPGYFIGHASSTISGLRAPLSFNCLSENGINNGGTCSLRDYEVYISNPQIGRMTAPNWPFENACQPNMARGARLQWELKSGVYSSFEVVVMNADVAVSTSSLNTVCWSGQVNTAAEQYVIPNANDNICTSPSDLAFNTPYYWFVRLRYNDGENWQWTNWYQFGVDDGHEGETYDVDNSFHQDGNKKTFQTYRHEFPTPYFSWSPSEVLIGEDPTIFTALNPMSQAYRSDNPILPIDCDIYGCSYNWSVIGDDYAEIENSSAATTSMWFKKTGNTTVRLGVTDDLGYMCIRSQIIENINYGLPIWREVKAE